MKSFILPLVLLFITTQPADNVLTRFKTPAGYEHVKTSPGSFASYLQNIPLKPRGTHTTTYRGTIANTDAYTAAVLDVSVGKQDLQQCADAMMRLRGEYLYQKQNYKAIAFNFTSGFKCDYVHYADGYRYQNEKWILKARKDYGYPNFLRYMNLVFSYAGTLSLEKELKKVNSIADIQAGDIFIRGGSPGHCFMVMDVAVNSANKKVFLLAQSYMPAQNIQLLQNGSPWFSADKDNKIPYGEIIDIRYLKRFE